MRIAYCISRKIFRIRTCDKDRSDIEFSLLMSRSFTMQNYYQCLPKIWQTAYHIMASDNLKKKQLKHLFSFRVR